MSGDAKLQRHRILRWAPGRQVWIHLVLEGLPPGAKQRGSVLKSLGPPDPGHWAAALAPAALARHRQAAVERWLIELTADAPCCFAHHTADAAGVADARGARRAARTDRAARQPPRTTCCGSRSSRWAASRTLPARPRTAPGA
jgi:hypothetical protein